MGALSRFVASMATLTRLAAGSPRNLRAYPDPIVYPGYAGRCPSGSLGLLPFGPGSHCALKGYGAAIRLHSDAGRVKLGAAPKGLLDLLLDLGRWDPLLDHLRPCRADGIAVTSERKRNNKLQPIDARRHLHALNPEQRRAVEYGIGGAAVSSPALLVAAGAGTGKTKVLAHRVAHLILNGRDPQRLLLLTFTRRAALEMTRRTQLILAEARGDATPGMSTPLSSLLPWSGTFHAIGSRLLRLHPGAIGLDASFTVLDRADSEDLLDLVRGELGLSQTASRFPRKGTCLAIYSYSINASCPLEETLAELFPWCAE
jgi:hypothetical protein